MRKKMRYSLIIIFISFNVFSQDKLFLKNGILIPCKIISISENNISYKDTSKNEMINILSKNQVLLAEYKSGDIFIFGSKNNTPLQNDSLPETKQQIRERKLKEWKPEEEKLKNNILGFYFHELYLGRLTVSYERLFANKSLGITFPVSLTYNTFYLIAQSTNNNFGPNPGVNFISGVDINYYYDLKAKLKYYFGPRIRYGTDMLLGGVEGLTVQIQNGIFRSRGKRFTSTLGCGVGFFKLSEKYATMPGYEPNQVYPWMSFTWRVGFRL